MRRRYKAALAGGGFVGLLAIGYAALADPEPTYGVMRGEAPADALWVVTHNVNFERPPERTVASLAALEADVLFLQETHADWEAPLREQLSSRYPHALFRHAPNEGGMAVFSRHPVEEVAHRPSPEDGGFPAWCLRLQTPLGALNVLAVHLHPPLDEDGRLMTGYFTTDGKRERELVDHLGCFAERPDLVVGDFNEETGSAVQHLESLGLVQAQVARGPPERTWTWDVDVTELEGRPDHIFVAPHLQVAAVQVHDGGGSDHRAIRAAIVRAP